MIEPMYRLLGFVLLARRPVVAATALGVFLLWLAVVREVVRASTTADALAAGAVPLVAAFAAWRLFQLPPGVVFRPAAVAPAAPQRTARCRASAYFEGQRRTEWRLLARSSLAFDAAGGLLLISPPPLRADPEDARKAFLARAQPTVAQLAAGERTPYPEYVYMPGAIVASSSRILYGSAEEYERTVGRCRIPRAALVDLRPGWQYAGLQRRPALRLAYYGADGALVAAYVAFGDEGQRTWALATLVGRKAEALSAALNAAQGG
jgi:hypothetical protein